MKDIDKLTAIFPTVFQRELALVDISIDELLRNFNFVQSMKQSSQLEVVQSVLFILPSFRNVLAGGIRTILMVAEDLSKSWGAAINLVIYQTLSEEILLDRREIEHHFPHMRFQLFSLKTGQDISFFPDSDIGFCTSWPTAFILAKYNRCKKKFYFMQDYESMFYPAGSVHALIEESYRLGFYCIANTPGIAEKYKLYSNDVASFTPGVDRTVFYPNEQQPLIKPYRIIFYGRPSNLRNAFALGIETLKQVKTYFGDDVQISSVGADWNPADFNVEGIIHNKGVLKNMKDIGAIYRKNHVGLIYMLTPHPSYQPLEYMASGCVTVTNHNKGTDWFFQHGENAELRSVIPDDMARGIITILQDPVRYNNLRNGGFKTIEGMSWDTAFETIKAFITQC